LLNLVRSLWKKDARDENPSFRFDRPMVVLQSDDWGRVGVRDAEGSRALLSSGISLGEHAYDSYTLETAEDLSALRHLLNRHRDSTGRCTSIVMNFVVANLDFSRMATEDFRRILLLPLREGLPGRWQRPGLVEAYRGGMVEGAFYPALHGLTHFCESAVENALRADRDRADLLRRLWSADTPYIYWRMPWVGYEYNNPEWPARGFLGAADQARLVAKAAAEFEAFFGFRAESACAPGYRANRDTHWAWASSGVKVAQNGSGVPRAPHLDDFGLLHLYRTFDFEPSQGEVSLDTYMKLAIECFGRGVPIVISTHSLNFHSSLRDFRGPTLKGLDELLSALERKFPDLLYLHDGDMYEIVMRGEYRAEGVMVPVRVIRLEPRRLAVRGRA